MFFLGSYSTPLKHLENCLFLLYLHPNLFQETQDNYLHQLDIKKYTNFAVGSVYTLPTLIFAYFYICFLCNYNLLYQFVEATPFQPSQPHCLFRRNLPLLPSVNDQSKILRYGKRWSPQMLPSRLRSIDAFPLSGLDGFPFLLSNAS